jgi:hypothetical protein
MLNNIVGIYGSPTPVSTNSYESIATVLVGAGGQSSIDFTSIPSTYKHLQIRGIAKRASGVTSAFIRFNSDTGTNYAYHELYGNGSVAQSGATTAVSYGILGPTPSAQFSVFIADILDYTNTNKNKTVRSLSGFDANGSGTIAFNSSLWLNTSAINTISIFPFSGSFAEYSSFALYGIKG